MKNYTVTFSDQQSEVIEALAAKLRAKPEDVLATLACVHGDTVDWNDAEEIEGHLRNLQAFVDEGIPMAEAAEKLGLEGEKTVDFSLPVEDFEYHLTQSRELLTGHLGGGHLEGEALVEHCKQRIEKHRGTDRDAGTLYDWEDHFAQYLNLHAVAKANGIEEGVKEVAS